MKAKMRRFNKKQAQSFRKRLLERRSRLVSVLKSQMESVRQGDEPRLSDTADSAAGAAQEFESFQVAEMEVRELKKIDGAIQRIEAGILDVCEECAGPIGRARLRALPYVTLCIRCQEQLEREGSQRVAEEGLWSNVVDAEAEMARSVGTPDSRLDGVESRY